MRVNPVQLGQLIDRLWQKTRDGVITWEQLSDRKTYQSVHGDFVVQLSEGPPQGLASARNPHADISVRRLSGTVVAEASSAHVNALATSFLEPDLSTQAKEKLRELYQYVSDRNPDLEELLKIL